MTNWKSSASCPPPILPIRHRALPDLYPPIFRYRLNRPTDNTKASRVRETVWCFFIRNDLLFVLLVFY